jgi:hypothetical protein
MSNEKINYKIVLVDLDLKNVSNLCEVDSVRFRHRYNQTLSDLLPLRPPNFILTVERDYTTYGRTKPFITRRIFRLNYGETPLF